MTPKHDSARAAARDLLARTAELPRRKRQLLAVLREYRTALHALASQPGTADHSGRS